MIVRLAALVRLAAAGALTFAGQLVHCSGALPVETVLSMKDIKNNVPISLSPNGLWVAYTLQPTLAATPQRGKVEYFSESGSSAGAASGEVWVANTRTREQFRISTPGSTSWDPCWSPNGQLLAFYSDADGLARLWVWDLRTRRTRLVSSTQIRVLNMWESPVWSPDSEFIATKTFGSRRESSLQEPDEQHQQPSAVVFDSKVPAPDEISSPPIQSVHGRRSLGDFEPYRANLSAFEVKTGKQISLATNEAIVGFWWSPNQQQILFAAVDSLVRDQFDFPIHRLELIDFVTGKHSKVAENLLLDVFGGLRVSWSPEGSHIAYLANRESKYDSKADCYLVDLRSSLGSPVLLSKNTPIIADLWTVPVWTDNGSSVLIADGAGLHDLSLSGTDRLIATQSVILALPVSYHRPEVHPDVSQSIFVWERNNNTFDLEVHRLHLLKGTDERVSEAQMALGRYPPFGIDESQNGEQITYVAQSSQLAPDLWIADKQLKDPQPVTTVNPELTKYAFGRAQLLSWRNDDGRVLQGALLLPRDFLPGHPCPLVVELYGGALLAPTMNLFGSSAAAEPNSQLLATRGYAVLLPDSPMGTGTPMLDLMKDVMPGISKAVDLGFAREDAIGIMGSSYGGYSTLSLISQTKRFKAAIAIAPVADIFSIFTFMEDNGAIDFIQWAIQSQGSMGANPWEHRERYIENSPVYSADRITTPVLLAVGSGDTLCVPQTRKMFASLKVLSKSAEYVEYPNSGHTFDLWTAAAKRDFANRMISWFDQHLKKQ